jgi:hypothetical protein
MADMPDGSVPQRAGWSRLVIEVRGVDVAMSSRRCALLERAR